MSAMINILYLTGSFFIVTAAGSIGDGVIYNDSNDDDTWDGVWNSAVSQNPTPGMIVGQYRPSATTKVTNPLTIRAPGPSTRPTG